MGMSHREPEKLRCIYTHTKRRTKNSALLSLVLVYLWALVQVGEAVTIHQDKDGDGATLRKVDAEVLQDLMAKWAPRAWQGASSSGQEPCSWPGIECGASSERSLLFGIRNVR
jgi:hypothetical protein